MQCYSNHPTFTFTLKNNSAIVHFCCPHNPPWTGWPQTWNTCTQGFLWTWKTQGILCNLRKNHNKIFLVCHSNICVKQLVTCYIAGVDVEWPLMKVIITVHLLFVAITYGKVSLLLWKSLENSGIFFSYFVATLLDVIFDGWLRCSWLHETFRCWLTGTATTQCVCYWRSCVEWWHLKRTANWLNPQKTAPTSDRIL